MSNQRPPPKCIRCGDVITRRINECRKRWRAKKYCGTTCAGAAFDEQTRARNAVSNAPR